ncbi:PREDICTED: palmitoyltransferase ZDHHC3 [Nicrophorus vespilloides]|uniref:Palmitoyltransferase n=1 Tax=Nicrophorus vespilloides TaxID=110193 RepID=A0ABM1N7T7_NICVS|nr:PREDICTED: palmitoyltransferase ZDHHC3 [Nicrophorus vespilloides]
MFINDPCGIFCILFTYFSIIYADYVVVRWIILHTMAESIWGAFNAVLFNIVILLLSISHFKAVVCDPGSIQLPQSRIDFSDINLDSGGDNADWTICTRCETYRPPRAHHCRICEKCIRRMDHHCPWINNCVGERNQKYFIQFLIYVGILAGHSIILIIFALVNSCVDCGLDVVVQQRIVTHCVILLLESTLFGIFSSAILFVQIQSIISDETSVEQVKKQGPYRPHKPKMALLTEVCGRQHPIMWLLPCSSTPKKFDTPLINYHI